MRAQLETRVGVSFNSLMKFSTKRTCRAETPGMTAMGLPLSKLSMLMV